MDPEAERADRERELGTQGYPSGTRGYPDRDPERCDRAPDDLDQGIDITRFLPPREAARFLPSDQPVAHDGKAGWALERGTRRAIWLPGEIQYDVLNRLPGAPRDEPGLTDVPAHGGLPDPAPSEDALRSHAREADRKRVQIGLKLTTSQAADLERAAELFGMTRTTMARLLVVRGASEILARGHPAD
jgi:hypothetical protein